MRQMACSGKYNAVMVNHIDCGIMECYLYLL